MQMTIGPPHCRLYHLVQLGERDRRRHDYLSVDGGLDLQQFDAQHQGMRKRQRTGKASTTGSRRCRASN
ncbi:hypothetical protein XAP412_50004 [Xanthomonas phaseoli pv. phaseoli]|uniref:Uncharacterized protein n=1 Tax=Xanthomonas campestris pv. phaseoli TaxID=317013 RepID=A0AB38DUH1_XANCH|nr:hypothetical protein XAP7430_100006 [Xanthomonas phaseoli pv. phaseoli]SON84870.1 hypothetical protein XAP6984_60005 [Xanthomonas phaseoli pv. phaseoli]SON86936.1 hypothetical protein XAP412_50004 [Xanthomonas phaseoli pv. phaseoli]